MYVIAPDGTVLAAAPASVTMTAASASQPAQATLAVGLADRTAPWTAAVYPANRTTAWLGASQFSGTGPAQLALTASGAGLKPGAYRAIAFLRPHFQLDELTVSLRLVAELPKAAR